MLRQIRDQWERRKTDCPTCDLFLLQYQKLTFHILYKKNIFFFAKLVQIKVVNSLHLLLW